MYSKEPRLIKEENCIPILLSFSLREVSSVTPYYYFWVILFIRFDGNNVRIAIASLFSMGIRMDLDEISHLCDSLQLHDDDTLVVTMEKSANSKNQERNCALSGRCWVIWRLVFEIVPLIVFVIIVNK